jgi:hypothetical protein
MSDCFGSIREDRVEWSIPMDNYADQIYRLLAIMEAKAQEYGVDTGYGDWFRAEVREYEHADAIKAYLPESQPGKYQLTFWFEIPRTTPA